MIEWRIYKQTIYSSHVSLNDYFDSMKMLKTIKNSKNGIGFVTIGNLDDISKIFVLGCSTNKRYLDLLEDGKFD